MSHLYSRIAFLATLLISATAFAAEGQTFGQATAVLILEIVFAVVLAVAPVLIGKLVLAMAKKWDFDIDDRTAQRIDELVGQAIEFAEEKSYQALRAGEAPKSGDEKRVAAVEFLRTRIADSKMTDLATDKLGDLIDAKVGQNRSWSNLVNRAADAADAVEDANEEE